MRVDFYGPVGASRQRGVVLAVGLILLLVMSLVMIIAMSGSILQERMAGALRNESIADVGADTALRDGELWVWKQVEALGGQLPPPANDTTIPFLPRSVTARNFRVANGWVTGGNAFGTGGAGISFTPTDYYKMAQTPAYTVELLGDAGLGSGKENPESHVKGAPGTETFYYYRITGRSTGGTQGVVRVAESTFSVSLFNPTSG